MILVLVMMTTVTTMIVITLDDEDDDDDGGDDGDVFSLCKGCLIAMVWNCWGVSPRCSINEPVQPPKNGVHPKDFPAYFKFNLVHMPRWTALHAKNGGS